MQSHYLSMILAHHPLTLCFVECLYGQELPYITLHLHFASSNVCIDKYYHTTYSVNILFCQMSVWISTTIHPLTFVLSNVCMYYQTSSILFCQMSGWKSSTIWLRSIFRADQVSNTGIRFFPAFLAPQACWPAVNLNNSHPCSANYLSLICPISTVPHNMMVIWVIHTLNINWKLPVPQSSCWIFVTWSHPVLCREYIPAYKTCLALAAFIFLSSGRSVNNNITRVHTHPLH